MVKAIAFPVVIYRWESWTIKKLITEEFMLLNCGAGKDLCESLGQQRNQNINPKGNHPEYSLERLMLKLKLQYFGYLMQTANSLEKILMLGKEKKMVTKDELAWWHHQLNVQEFKQAIGDSEGQGSLVCCSLSGCKELGMTEQLNDNDREVVWTIGVMWVKVWRHKRWFVFRELKFGGSIQEKLLKSNLEPGSEMLWFADLQITG